jgi:hypothetical protein
MSSKEDVKVLLAKENITLTELAKELSNKLKKTYTLAGLSRKLAIDSLKYSEFKSIAEILGYRIELIKEKQAFSD